MKPTGWVFQLAQRYLFPRHRCGTFFTWISIVGIAAGVALLTIVLSIMNGFDAHIEHKLVQINGSIKILSDTLIHPTPQLVETIRQTPHVKAVTPFAQGVALLQYKNRVAFPKCLGVDPQTVDAVIPLKQFVQAGALENWQEGALISASLAQEFKLTIGHTIELYSPLALEAIKNEEMILPQEIPVTGIFRTGWAQIDRDTILLPLPVLQELYGLGDRIHGFSIDADHSKLAETCQALNQSLPNGLTASAWFTLNEDFLYILKLEKAMCFFVLLFVVLIAAFSMSSGLLSSVVRKRREIALLRTWGASRFELTLLFSYQSCLLCLLGTSIGFASAAFMLTYRNIILQWLTGWLLPSDVLWKFYDVETLPVAYCWKDFALIAAFTVVITVFATIIPVWRVHRLPLIHSLRRE